MDEIVVDIPKNSTEIIRVQPTEFNGHELIDVRVFYRREERDDYKPSPKGISFRRTLLPAVTDTLLQILDEEMPEVPRDP